MTKDKLIRKLHNALSDAQKHLEFCGYGDRYERECATEEKLPDKIEEALNDGDAYLSSNIKIKVSLK